MLLQLSHFPLPYFNLLILKQVIIAFFFFIIAFKAGSKQHFTKGDPTKRDG